MRCLVTGATGFIGWHLVERLARDRHDVVAWGRGAGGSPWPGCDVTIENIDICDAGVVERAVATADPDVIFHLAAQSLPMRSWENPVETFHVNVDGTVNLLEAVRKAAGRPRRVLVAGSSGIYASSKDGAPIGEDAACEPGSPYAVSKMASDHLAALYGRAFGMDIVRFFPFFWIGPRKTGDVASDLARRIVAIEKGAEPRLVIGRTDTVRDMIDVRDGIAALLVLAEKGVSGGAYNICRGEGTAISELLAQFKRVAFRAFEVTTDPALMRPVDEPVRIGDPGRIFALGWRPAAPLERSVADILEYWRRQPVAA